MLILGLNHLWFRVVFWSRYFVCMVNYLPVSRSVLGNVPDGFKLLNVHVVTRHGDRTPLTNLPFRQKATLRCTVDTTGDALATRYVGAMEAFSMKTRPGSMASRLDLFPRQPRCQGSGQLTGIGAVQHLRSGDFLRQVYATKHGLVDDGGDGSDIEFHTTRTRRTYQSGVAFLYGLLPRADFTTMPVHVSDNIHFCRPGRSGLPCRCMHVSQLDRNPDKARRNHTLTAAAIQRDLAGPFDTDVANVPHPMALADGLAAYACHGDRLPCSDVDDSACITWSMVGRVWKFIDSVCTADAASDNVNKRNHLVVHPLLQEIVSRMINVTTGLPAAKLILYSGHDSTLTPLAMALGIYTGRWPPYASRLIFELYATGRAYFIRLLFNGEDRTKYLRFCAESQLIKGLCPFRNFEHFVRHHQMQMIGESNYIAACNLK